MKSRSISVGKSCRRPRKDLGPNAVDPAQEKLLEAMVVKEQRFGRKNGKGFYDYPAQGPKTLWPGLAEIAGKELDPDTISVHDLKGSAALYAGARGGALHGGEGVTDPREADVGSILGFGFAPFTGGVLSLYRRRRRQSVRRARAGVGEQIRRALRAGRGAGRDGGEGREFLRQIRASAEGGVTDIVT